MSINSSVLFKKKIVAFRGFYLYLVVVLVNYVINKRLFPSFLCNSAILRGNTGICTLFAITLY